MHRHRRTNRHLVAALDYFTSEQLISLKPSELAGESSPITTTLDKDKINRVLSTDNPMTTDRFNMDRSSPIDELPDTSP
ncbi:MAG: hypothetical protein R3C09_17205 [Pirellulaceae bacterium]